ncbi:MAG: hypothetical protein NC319_06130 [Butyricicoccus sp.]|nr:hypothetical protein [Butyricicoccus sp.]
MTRFELKKVFSRRINQIALLVLAALLVAFVVAGVGNVSYYVYDENAEDGLIRITGHAAAARLRADAEQYEGLLTADALRKVIEDNIEIHSMPQAQSQAIADRNYAYTFSQGYKEIRTLFALAYTPFNEYDYFAIDGLEPEDAERFYDLRRESFLEWLELNKDATNMYPEEEQEFILQRYDELEMPLLYRPACGWTELFNKLNSLEIVLVFFLAFLLSGIFTDEARLKTDSIFYSSYHGRGKAVWAKVKAGLIITNGVYWLSVLALSTALLFALGASGWDCPIQAVGSNWKSIYNITVLREYFLILLCGWAGVSVIAMITMLVSAKTSSATLSVAVPFLLIFLPQLIAEFVNVNDVTKLLGLLPDHLLQVNTVIKTYNLYSVGGHIFAELELTPWLHLALSALLLPLLYRVYRSKEPV